jgi:ribose transport system permease protein
MGHVSDGLSARRTKKKPVTLPRVDDDWRLVCSSDAHDREHAETRSERGVCKRTKLCKTPNPRKQVFRSSSALVIAVGRTAFQPGKDSFSSDRGVVYSFCLTLNQFATAGNLISLLQSVAILGVLGVGMAFVIIGRGIDLAMVTVMAISVAWMFNEINRGLSIAAAFGLGIGLAALVGVANGVLVAYFEIPAIFTTLAMATLLYGLGRFLLIDSDAVFLGDRLNTFKTIGAGYVWGIPASIIWAAVIALFCFVVLRYTKFGRYIYAMGDNPLAARIIGIPVRPMIVLQYVASALIAFAAGLILSATVSSMNTRLANSTMIYDVILVVVIGGIGLSGGKGGIRNVIIGTLLVGTLINGMTMLDLSYTEQKIIKSLILLVAVVIDSIVNPRDEQTAQQGDI